MARDPAEGGSRRLLVLGAGPAQLGLLEAARGRGLYVVAADRDPGAPGFRFADRRAIVSAEDEPAIGRLAAAERVDGIVAPGIDWPVGIASRVAARLGLPNPVDPTAAALATNKLRQRERFAQDGVPHARYEMCATLEAAEGAAERLGYPCVLKAPDRQGQKGLAFVAAEGQLEAAFALAQAASRSGYVLVEEAVAAREVTINAFSLEGRFHPLTVTDRLVAEPPAFGVALAHVWPSSLDPEQIGAAVEAARAAAASLGIRSGPTYTQVLVAGDGPRVGELAARLGGGHDAELCAAALGVDLNGLVLSQAFGEPVGEEALRPASTGGGACVRFLVAPPGLLEAIEGADDVAGAEGVVWVRLYREPGHSFGPLLRGSDRAGAVLAVGPTREEALARAESAAERIRFQTVDAAVAQPT